MIDSYRKRPLRDYHRKSVLVPKPRFEAPGFKATVVFVSFLHQITMPPAAGESVKRGQDFEVGRHSIPRARENAQKPILPQ
ncbi:MAG: hypothetical protein CBB70_14425 [Planctomycetaceae bacterium TMED10]|nr:MAG: hypothetical protein CBB70_14425 [Planctomycetaceae bacterium TMED10]